MFIYSILRERKTGEDTEVGITTINKDETNKYIKSCFDEEWKEYIKTYQNAETYRSFKNRVIAEDYLVAIKNRKTRVALRKFRL